MKCTVKSRNLLRVGQKVRLLDGNTVEDEGVISRMEDDAITFKSLHRYSGEETELVCFGNPAGAAWKVLGEDPMTGARTYSQRGPSYRLKTLPKDAVIKPKISKSTKASKRRRKVT